MGRLANKVLLKEYVREVLQEDDYGGVYGDLAMYDATMSPWGVSFGSNDQLYNIFVRPFTDVVDTALGKTKELSAKAQTLVKVAFETIATTIIPVLTDSYNEIFEKEKEQIDKIRQEYGEVYKANWDAFKDEDFQLLMFMYDPGKYVGSRVAKTSARAAVGLLSAVTGGALDSYLDKVKGALGADEEPRTEPLARGGAKKEKNIGAALGGYGGGYDVGWGAMEGVIREDAEGEQQPSAEQLLSNPKLITAVNNSPTARKMHQQAQQIIRAPLQQVYKQAQAVLKANSLQDLQQKLGKRIKGAEKLNQIEPKARQAAEQALLATTKKSMRAFYIKSLQQQAKKFAGSPIEQEYAQALSKIKSL